MGATRSLLPQLVGIVSPQDLIRATAYQKNGQLRFLGATYHHVTTLPPEPRDLVQRLRDDTVDARWATENQSLSKNGEILAAEI